MSELKSIHSYILNKDYLSAYNLVEKAAKQNSISQQNIEIFRSSPWYLKQRLKPKTLKSNGEKANSINIKNINARNQNRTLSIHYCVMLMMDEILVTKKTIASLIEQMTEYDSAFILLNGFEDKSLMRRLMKHTGVYCFSSKGNLGVAGGRNYLYSKIFNANKYADYIVNLDNDVAIPQDFCSNVRDAAIKTSDVEGIGIIGCVIADYKKRLIRQFIESKSVTYQSYLDATINSYYTDELRYYLSSKNENLYWHCGTHSHYQNVYLDQLETTLPSVEELFLSNNHSIDFTAPNSWIEISNSAGCFQLFKAKLLQEYGYLNEKFSPYFWEDSEFSCRLIKHGLKNYTTTEIMLCHGTDNRHNTREIGDYVLKKHVNEYRARVIFQSDIAETNPPDILSSLSNRSQHTNRSEDKEKNESSLIGIYKGLAQLGYHPNKKATLEYRNNIINNLKNINTQELDSTENIELKKYGDIETVKEKISSVEMSTDLKTFYDIHRNEECILLCNGPSLRETNLGALKALDIPIFASNSSYILANELDFTSTYFVCEDNHVIHDNLTEIKKLSHCQKFIPNKYFEYIGRMENLYYLPTNWDAYYKSKSSFENPEFSEDISKIIYVGQTVTYLMLQIAYYMGFKTVYIVGLDFSYKIPKGSEIKENSVDHIDDDPNHFHKDYFGKGKQWHFPKLDSCLQSYIKANKKYIDNNRAIINCTTRTKLNAFNKSGMIKGVKVKTPHHSNTDLSTFLNCYFERSSATGNCRDTWLRSGLTEKWSLFMSDCNILYYSGNDSFYMIDRKKELCEFPFLSSFDSTSNVNYVYLNLTSNLHQLDKKLYWAYNLYGILIDEDICRPEFINAVINESLSKWKHFCLIKTQTMIYLKRVC